MLSRKTIEFKLSLDASQGWYLWSVLRALRRSWNFSVGVWETTPSLKAGTVKKVLGTKFWKSIPRGASSYVNDYISFVVARAWSEYRKGRRSRPRNKHRTGNTIFSASFRGQCKLDGRKVRLPGLGWLTVKGLDTRLGKLLKRQSQRMRSDPFRYPELAKDLARNEARKAALARFDPALPFCQPLPCVGRTYWKAFAQAAKTPPEKVRVLTFDEIIEKHCTPTCCKIVRRPSGWYLQITVSQQLKRSDGKKDVGVTLTKDSYCTSQGKFVIQEPPERMLERRKALLIAQAKKEPGSYRWCELRQKIEKIDERIERRTLGFCHYHSSWLADTSRYLVVRGNSSMKPLLQQKCQERGVRLEFVS